MKIQEVKINDTLMLQICRTVADFDAFDKSVRLSNDWNPVMAAVINAVRHTELSIDDNDELSLRWMRMVRRQPERELNDTSFLNSVLNHLSYVLLPADAVVRVQAAGEKILQVMIIGGKQIIAMNLINHTQALEGVLARNPASLPTPKQLPVVLQKTIPAETNSPEQIQEILNRLDQLNANQQQLNHRMDFILETLARLKIVTPQESVPL